MHNQKKVNFSLEYNLRPIVEETAQAHNEHAKRMEEFITENPIAIELIE